MSKEKITSEMAINIEAVPSTENPNIKTEPIQTQSTVLFMDDPEFTGEYSVNEYSSPPRRSSIHDDMSDDSIKNRALSKRTDEIQEEESTEQFFNEMEYDYESDDAEYMARKELVSFGKVNDITDPKDPKAILLQTETQALHLSKLPVLPPIIPDGSQDRIFHVDSVSSQSSFPSSSVHTLLVVESQKADFFENLGEIPNIEDISSTSEIEVVQQIPNIPKVVPVDGHFVDPLTGVYLSVDTKDEKELSVILEAEALEKEEENTEEEFGSDESCFEDFDAKYPQDSEEKTFVTEEDDEDFLESLITKKQTETKVEFSPIIDEEEEERLRQKDILITEVDIFLQELLKEVVQFVDKNQSQYIFRANLDRMKLFRKIETIVSELILETRTLGFLDRKAAEYFRRRHLIRYLCSEKPNSRLHEFEKYKEASQNLDRLLGEETIMITQTTSKIDELEHLRDQLEEGEKFEKTKFENLVRTTLKRDGMPHLDEVMEKDLRKIKDLAHQITETRVAVIQRQHVVGTLRAKIEELENIGNGLRVADYESIQRQTVALSKKIEERNRDLGKFHERFQSSLHVLAHSQLRNEVLVRGIEIQDNKLESFSQEKAACRTVVYELKKQRQKIQRQISDLSHQSGILDKPILLRDYDETVERIEKKRKDVEELRQTQKKLEYKLKQLEKTCSTE